MSCQDTQSDESLSWDPINMNVGNEVQRGDLVHGPSWKKAVGNSAECFLTCYP